MLVCRTLYDAKEGNLILFREGTHIIVNKDSDTEHNIVVRKGNIYYDKYIDLLRRK